MSNSTIKMTVDEIFKELEKRGISIEEASHIFDIPFSEMNDYKNGKYMPRVVKVGIMSAFMNWNDSKMSVDIWDMLCFMDHEIESCRECGKEVRLNRFKTIYGDDEYRLNVPKSVWLPPEFIYCEVCGPKILEEAMRKQEAEMSEKWKIDNEKN